jgi:PAS domain S-box
VSIIKTIRTKTVARRLCFFLLCLVLLLNLSGCAFGRQSTAITVYPEYEDYRDIPGITQEEIEQIEHLKASHMTLIYGMCPSTEAFYDEQGNVNGYSALFCAWLTDLFGIQFVPQIVEWDDLHSQMRAGTIDFTGELTSNSERLKTYYMTSSIAERSIHTIRLQGAEKLGEIAQERSLRFAFLAGTNTEALVAPVAEYEFESSLINGYDEVVAALRSREIDAFLIDSPAEEAFDAYDGIVSESFFPLIYTPVSLATLDAQLSPIVSVLQKYLDQGAMPRLTKLYNEGYQEYLQHKLFLKLTEGEKAYIANHVNNDMPISVAMEFELYPTIFFNAREDEWQGIAGDVLKEIAKLTGLRFEAVNTPDNAWHVLLDMLESGQVSMTTELIYSAERAGRFLWADKPYTEDRYALLSTIEYENISINQVFHSKVGLIHESAYAEVFHTWFPEHPNTVVYMNIDDAFKALEKGEVDLLMTAKNLLLRVTNYMEQPGFKANLVFERSYGSSFGFNKDEAILRSIVSKVQELVDTESITSRWTSKVFDYNSKILRDMIPYVVAFSIMLLIALIVVVYLFLKNRKINKNLERLVAERASELALQTATLTTVFESIPDLIFCKDLDCNFTQLNNSFKKHFNCSDDIIGKNDEIGLGLPADMAAEYRKTDREIISGCKSITVEETIPSADGTFPLFETIKTPLIQNGNPVGIVCISRNITERKAVEEELESASRAKGDFLSRMSHEIRTPLNAIIGMNNIAMNSNDLEKTHQCHERIDDASRHLLGIINDILDMSKIEADKFELSRSEFDFEKTLMSIINVTHFRAEEKNQELVVHLGRDVPAIILGDEIRLSQVITNLLSNAVKFTPKNGSILLNIEKIADSDSDVTLQFEVVDNGIGISEEQQARLFASFEQADSSISRKFGGTGLGLAISKRIVELMDGRIWIESELGCGSKFAFTIKVQKCEEKIHTKISPRIDKSNIRILVVDDSEETLRSFSQVMEAHCLPCDVATSGFEALKMIKQCEEEPYNIFFVDWQMPGMDGIELTKRIKEITGDNAVVFMISIAAWNIIERKAFLAGVKSFIPKPVFPSSIVNAINECLGVESAKAEAHSQGADTIPDLNGKCILIADDIPINREIMSAVLEETGVAIDFAVDGQMAVAMFCEKQSEYSLILMDIQMPGMDGYEATQQIRTLPQSWAKEIPILAMTANVFKEDIEKCLAAGMNDHVGKPIDLGDLFTKLKKYLT